MCDLCRNSTLCCGHCPQVVQRLVCAERSRQQTTNDDDDDSEADIDSVEAVGFSPRSHQPRCLSAAYFRK